MLCIIVGQQNIESLKKHWILVAPTVFASEGLSGFRAQIFPVSEGNKAFLSSNVRFLIDIGFLIAVYRVLNHRVMLTDVHPDTPFSVGLLNLYRPFVVQVNQNGIMSSMST